MYIMELKLLGQTLRLEIILLCLILGTLIFMLTTCSCSKLSFSEAKDAVKEGLSNMSGLNDQIMTDSPNSWSNKAKEYASGMGYESILESQKTNVGTPVPLQDTMVIFRDNKFKPECCPSTYTSSTGCACISSDQSQYLNQRGGNRTIAGSEF